MKVTKLLVGLMLLVSLVAIPAKAQTSQEAALNINRVIKLIDAQGDIVDKVEKETYPALKTKADRLTDVNDMLKGAVSHLIAKDADLNMRWNQHDAAVSDHNNSQCTAPANNPNACAAYQAEANRLNAQGAALKAEQDGNNTYRQGLKERYDQLTKDTEQWTADKKKADGEREDALSQIQKLLTEVTKWANIYGGCMDNIPNATDEEIKHTCGNIQFDNVRKNLGKVRNQGTGGGSSNGPHN